MDPFTADAIGQYLAYRHNRWPRTGNAPAGDPTRPLLVGAFLTRLAKQRVEARRGPRGFTNSDGDLGKQQFRPEC